MDPEQLLLAEVARKLNRLDYIGAKPEDVVLYTECPVSTSTDIYIDDEDWTSNQQRIFVYITI